MLPVYQFSGAGAHGAGRSTEARGTDGQAPAAPAGRRDGNRIPTMPRNKQALKRARATPKGRRVDPQAREDVLALLGTMPRAAGIC